MPPLASIHTGLSLTWFYSMTKNIAKIANLQRVMFDAALVNLASSEAGNQFSIGIHKGGSILLTHILWIITAEWEKPAEKRLE